MMAALLMVGGWYYAVLPLCLYHLAMTLEGVESREQLALIAGERSITEVQGFHIGALCRWSTFAALLLSPLSQMARVA